MVVNKGLLSSFIICNITMQTPGSATPPTYSGRQDEDIGFRCGGPSQQGNYSLDICCQVKGMATCTVQAVVAQAVVQVRPKPTANYF